MSAKAVVWLGTRTDRVDAMRAFYRALFDTEPLVDTPGFVVFRLPAGDTVELFGLDEPDHLHFTTGPVAGFLVDDLAASILRLPDIGAELLGTPAVEGGGGWAHFRAPDGNVYEITESRDHPAHGSAATRTDLPALAAEDHACAVCSISYTSVGVDDAVATIRTLPDAYRSAVLALGDEPLRRRPEPSTWSALEYLCHARDVYTVSIVRLHRVRTEHLPVLEPMLNDLRAARLSYNRRDPDAVTDELADAVDGFCEEVARVPADGWDRRATRQPGEWRTARWLVRQAMHEGVHHLRDIATVAAP